MDDASTELALPEPTPFDPLARVGQDIAFLDAHLLNVVAKRKELASVVEHIKAILGGNQPIFRREVEDARLAAIAELAEQMGVNPNFARALLQFIISESCKDQMIQRESVGGTYLRTIGDLSYAQLKGNLYELTRAVASTYDTDYATHFPATQIYLDFESQIIEAVIGEIHPEQRLKALDIGCGTGAASILLSNFFRKVEGVDLSMEMLVQAKINAVNHPVSVKPDTSKWGPTPTRDEPWASDGIDFMLGDVEDPIYWKRHADSSFDLVVMTLGTGGDFLNIQLVLGEIHRILKPQGRFVFSFYNSNSLFGKMPMLPWVSSLAASVDLDRECLDVHFGNQIYSLFARSYTADQVEEMLPRNLAMTHYYTCPTVAPIIPTSLLLDPTLFASQRAMDHALAPSAEQGAYLLVTGRKS